MELIQELFQNTNDFIEVREIPNGKQHFFNKENIKLYDPPIDKNIYFGVFSRSEKSGKAKACNTTGALWADYDEGMKDLTSIQP